MKYFLSITLGLVLAFPVASFAQGTASVGSAVKIETANSGAIEFSYSIPTDSELVVQVDCSADAAFFIEQTGAVISCNEGYSVANPGEGGKIKIVPYDIPEDLKAAYMLVRLGGDGGSETIAEQTVDLKKTNPLPLFSQISVRQEEPTKARVTAEWKTLEKANIALTVGCDSEDLVLVTPTGDRYSCNQSIELAKNSSEGKVVLSAENHSSQEGLLFTFVAEKDGEIGALKNISFTFETTTEQVATGETEQSIIERLIAQVKTLLQVVASLFS